MGVANACYTEFVEAFSALRCALRMQQATARKGPVFPLRFLEHDEHVLGIDIVRGELLREALKPLPFHLHAAPDGPQNLNDCEILRARCREIGIGRINAQRIVVNVEMR